MEAVLLKRYAKYHGVDLGERDGAHAIGYLGAMLRREGEPLDEARDRVVRELTRIEDAETLLNWQVTSLSHGTAFVDVRKAHEKAACYLFTWACIEPKKWREVKP